MEFDTSSDSEDEVLMLEILRRNSARREWVNSVNRKRQTHGQYANLVTSELASEPEKFFNYFRMTQDQFENLFCLVKDHIAKQDTSFRKCIKAKERLAICLRFLATGDSYASLHYNYRMGKSTISGIVTDVCEAIWTKLQPIYMAQPTQQEWENMARVFHTRWNLPNCVGAIDGKHVVIKPPHPYLTLKVVAYCTAENPCGEVVSHMPMSPGNSGSLYHNYKGTHSIVLMALVDPEYNFTVVDVGGYGSSSDGGIFSRMKLSALLAVNGLQIPPPKELPNMPELGPIPHFIVGDEAFPLKPYLLRPYPGKNLDKRQRLYNYRHCRARRISENCFGILANQFRLYHRKLELCPDNADKVVLATCVLHNFIRKTGTASQSWQDQDETEEAAGLVDLERVGHHSSKDGLGVREVVPWQEERCFGRAR